MTGNLQPLDQKFPVVDNQGRPTEYFTRWAQQRQIDIGDSITLGDLEAFLTAHKLVAGHGIILTPDGDINNSPNVSIANGTGLNFDVMGNLKLADTAVAPGTYGDATHVPAIVVDQQGRITGVTLVAISGGGNEAAVTKPTASQFTLLNGGVGTTMLDTTFGVDLEAPTTGNIHFAEWNTAPVGTTFTVTMRGAAMCPFSGGGYSNCIIFRNSSNGRILIFGDFSNSTQMLVQNWTSFSAFSANVVGPSTAACAYWRWRRIVVTAGSMSFQVSPDGAAWATISPGLAGTTLASFLTAAGGTVDQVGFGIFSTGGTICSSFTLV